MISGPQLEDLQKALDEAWAFWRDVPDGNRYHTLTHQLGLFVHAVAQDALQSGKAKLTSPIPGVGMVTLHVAMTDCQRIITNHLHVTDFDEVVSEYLMRLCKKYLDYPDIQHVRSVAYVRMGIVQTAYTLERRLANLRKKEVLANEMDNRITQTGLPEKSLSKTDGYGWIASQDPLYPRYPDAGLDVSAGAVIKDLEDYQIFQRLETLWFYPYIDHPASGRLPKSFSGLSLRYVYVALRYNAGLSFTEIAKELGIHSSRLTELKKEYTRLFPNIQSNAWLKLEKKFKPIRVEEPMLRRMNLIGVHYRYSLLKAADDGGVRKSILRSKRILWRLFRFAVELANKPDDGFSDTLHLIVLDEKKRPDVEITVKQGRGSLHLSDSSLLTKK